MRRATIALALLSTAAVAQTDAPPFDPSRCDPAQRAGPPLAPHEAEACRALWSRSIEEARSRAEAWREEMARQRAERRAAAQSRARGEAGATPLSVFIGEWLERGDIVVTDLGPRVFVGSGLEPARAEDFVTLDAPRSPHRRNARALERAKRTHPRPD